VPNDILCGIEGLESASEPSPSSPVGNEMERDIFRDDDDDDDESFDLDRNHDGDDSFDLERSVLDWRVGLCCLPWYFKDLLESGRAWLAPNLSVICEYPNAIELHFLFILSRSILFCVGTAGCLGVCGMLGSFCFSHI